MFSTGGLSFHFARARRCDRDARKALARDAVLGDGRFPQLAAGVAPAADLGAHGEVGGTVVGRVAGRRSEQEVVDTLGVGLHVAGEAAEHLADGGAGLFRRVLEEDVIAVGDLDEVVAAPARLLALCRRGVGCTQTPVASVEMQKAVFIASSRMALTTDAPTVVPASSIQRHIVPRSIGTPRRAKRSSWRCSGRPSQYLSTTMWAMRETLPIARGNSSRRHRRGDDGGRLGRWVGGVGHAVLYSSDDEAARAAALPRDLARSPRRHR